MSNFKSYIKKPVIVEAIQIPMEGETWGKDLEELVLKQKWEKTKLGGVYIDTLEGNMWGKPTDYIIKGIKGEYYPCDADIFELTYALHGESDA